MTKTQRMKEAGLKEVRSMWYPPEMHDDVKALVKRYYGYYKLKRDVINKLNKFVEKVL